MIFRFRYREAGGHTHVGLWAGRSPTSLGKCGEFTMQNEEWHAFRMMHEVFVPGVLHVCEFINADRSSKKPQEE